MAKVKVKVGIRLRRRKNAVVAAVMLAPQRMALDSGNRM
jgi:hypothetical protein